MRPPLWHPLHLVLGLTLWLLWFSAAYGGLSLACTLAPPAPALGARTWINALLLLLTLLTAGLLLLLAWRSRRQLLAASGSGQRRFVLRVAAGLYLAAAFATLVGGLPAAVLPPCL